MIIFPILLWSVVILGVGWVQAQHGAEGVTTVVTFVSALLAIAPLLPVWPWKMSQFRQPSTLQQLEEAASALAVAVRRQWEREASRRRMDDPPMPVRWRIDDSASTGSPRGALPPYGDVSSLIGRFGTGPCRMVVTGDPGSGKTAVTVLLTLELLKAPPPSRVPVLLQVSSWNPAENIESWLRRRIMADYPFLRNAARYGGSVVSDLLDQRRLVPILDGLDEMPEGRRLAALRAIHDDIPQGQPVVVTCRTDEFDVLDSERMRGTVVVRLMPLDADDAGTYLLDAVPSSLLDRWDPVITSITENPESALATTLRKPLMLFLAQNAYERWGAEPAELLDRTRFSRAERIETHLLDTFIPAVFSRRRRDAVADGARPIRYWDPATAERWLCFLARHLKRVGARELAWWHLDVEVPRSALAVLRSVFGGVVCSLLGWLFFGLFGRPLFGLGFGLLVGVTGGWLVRTFTRDRMPKRVVPRLLRWEEFSLEQLVHDLGFGVVGAIVGGSMVGVLYGAGWGMGAGLLFGLTFGLSRRFTEPTEPDEAVSPVGLLRGDRATVRSACLLGAVVGVIVGGFLGGVVGASTRGLVVDLAGPVQEGLLGALVGGLLGSAGPALVTEAASAWGRFVATRTWLALRGVTPLALMTFLDDAHRLGVFRQVGPYYQFRSAVLQDRLTDRGAVR